MYAAASEAKERAKRKTASHATGGRGLARTAGELEEIVRCLEEVKKVEAEAVCSLADVLEG